MTTVKTWDISGMGGNYETNCQRMLWAGREYLKTLKDPKEILKGREMFRPESLAACKEAMYKVSPGCTGAMGSWTMGHLAYIANHGYEKWFEDMRKARAPEQPTEFDPEDQT